MNKDLERMCNEVPPGYWESLMELVRLAPKLPQKDGEADFPDPLG
jgi:hypothetical protein